MKPVNALGEEAGLEESQNFGSGNNSTVDVVNLPKT
jgi:hypothetical protein